MRYLRGWPVKLGVHCPESYGNDRRNKRKTIVVDGGIAKREPEPLQSSV
jgi:hypothetical protein